jgi:hypothetical protein
VFAGIAGAIGRLPWMPTSFVRVVAALVVAILLVSPAIQKEASWLMPILVLLIVACWELAEKLGNKVSGEALPLSAAIVFGMAWLFILLAHWTSFAEASGFLAACCLGVAIVAWARRSDASGLAPIIAIALPGLMVLVRWDRGDEIPITGYLAIALAPLGLVPAAVMARCERVPKWLLRTAIVVGPALIAAIGLTYGFIYGSLPTVDS